MFNKTILIASLLASVTAQSNNSYSLTEAKKVLTDKEYKQYSHDVWESQRKKAAVTDNSDQLLNKSGAILTVGPGLDCDFPNILTALNFAAPGNSIVVASGTYTGGEAKLTINKDLSITGGWNSNCQGYAGGKTNLQLDDTGAVITIDVSGGKNIVISNFDISGSQSGNQLLFTSGIHASGDGTVTVRNSSIHNNEAFLGGGISVINGVTLNISGNTEIYANTASGQGGGIYCNQSTLNIIDTKIGRFDNGEEQGNIVLGEGSQGGGLYSSACTSFLGQSNIGNGPVEINYNKSQLGAGIYSVDSNLDFGQKGSRMSFNGTSFSQSGNGNAILATNVNNITFNDLEITDNLEGVQIQISGSSDLIMKSTCDSPPCSLISRNLDTPIALLNQATATFLQTKITHNNALKIFSINGTGNTGLYVLNTQITDNQTSGSNNAIISDHNETIINFEHVTIANNTGFQSIVSGFGNSQRTTNFDGSIIWGNAAINLMSLDYPGDINISNSVIQYNPDGMANTVLENPLFVNSDNDNYHIQFNSPARDYFNSDISIDIEGDSRPQGLLDDAGADEWTDLIFANDFEEL